MQLQTNYRLPLHAFSSSQPSLPSYNPPSILPCGYSNSSNYVLTLTSTKALFEFCISGCTLLLTCGLTDAVCDHDGRLRFSRGGFCCELVLMEVMCLPSQARHWTKGCLLWVTYWTCANAIRPHKTAGRNFTFGSKQQRMLRFISFCWRLCDPGCTACLHRITFCSADDLDRMYTPYSQS